MITLCFTRSLKRERRRAEIYKRRLMEVNDKLVNATEQLKEQLAVSNQRSDFFQEEFFKSQAKHKAVESKKEEIKLLLSELSEKAKEFDAESLRLDAENADLKNELCEKNEVIANLTNDCIEMCEIIKKYESESITVKTEPDENLISQDVQQVS